MGNNHDEHKEGAQQEAPIIQIRVMREGVDVKWYGFRDFTGVLVALSAAIEAVEHKASSNSIVQVKKPGIILGGE
jgi:hypothetical protein